MYMQNWNSWDEKNKIYKQEYIIFILGFIGLLIMASLFIFILRFSNFIIQLIIGIFIIIIDIYISISWIILLRDDAILLKKFQNYYFLPLKINSKIVFHAIRTGLARRNINFSQLEKNQYQSKDIGGTWMVRGIFLLKDNNLEILLLYRIKEIHQSEIIVGPYSEDIHEILREISENIII